MSLMILESLPTSSLKGLLDHLGEIDDPREPWRVAHPLCEVLLLVVCGTICDCNDYDAIAAWGQAHLAVLRRYRPFHHGVPSGRWLTLLMNRIDPGLFAHAFTDWAEQAKDPACAAGWVACGGARHLARAARSCRHRRQDLAPQP